MRECADCGGSVDDNVTCPACGAPPPPAPWPPVPVPRTTVPPSRHWPDVAPAPLAPPEPAPPAGAPARRVGPRLLVGVIVAVLAIGGVVAAVVVSRDDNASSPPTGDARPTSITYRSEDRQVTVRMPVPPSVTPLPPPIKGAAAVAAVSATERLFLEVHPGPVAKSQVRATLRAHLSLAVGVTGATLNKTSDTTFRGHPAISGTGTYHGDPLQFLAFSAHDSEYALVVHAKNGVDAVMRMFEDSVQIQTG